MWQLFLGAIQLAIVGGALYADFTDNVSGGHPGHLLFGAGATAFLLTYILNSVVTWVGGLLKRANDRKAARIAHRSEFPRLHQD